MSYKKKYEKALNEIEEKGDLDKVYKNNLIAKMLVKWKFPLFPYGRFYQQFIAGFLVWMICWGGVMFVATPVFRTGRNLGLQYIILLTSSIIMGLIYAFKARHLKNKWKLTEWRLL